MSEWRSIDELTRTGPYAVARWRAWFDGIADEFDHAVEWWLHVSSDHSDHVDVLAMAAQAARRAYHRWVAALTAYNAFMDAEAARG